jgi:hypothetical protein
LRMAYSPSRYQRSRRQNAKFVWWTLTESVLFLKHKITQRRVIRYSFACVCLCVCVCTDIYIQTFLSSAHWNGRVRVAILYSIWNRCHRRDEEMLLSLWSVCRRCENENCPSSGMSVATICTGFHVILNAGHNWHTCGNFCLELCVPVQS